MDPMSLTKVDATLRPYLFESEADSVSSTVAAWLEDGLAARVVRGRRARTLQGLFDEFAAALQFPTYFGENVDAFDECIADLECLPPGSGYVIVIVEPDELLADESDAVFEWFAHSLASAASQWAQPVEVGAWWDRPPVAFHVVLAGDRARLEAESRRWAHVGLPGVAFGSVGN